MDVREEMHRIRIEHGMTLRDIAAKCDLHFGTVHKAEIQPVRWETIHVILVAGYNIRPGTANYEAVKEAWLAERLDRRPSARISSVIHAAAAEMTGEQLEKFEAAIAELAKKITAAPRKKRR